MKESGLLPVTGRLLKSFNFAYQPRSHAVDLVQALHVILRMLDRLNASGTSCHAAAPSCRSQKCCLSLLQSPLVDLGMRREDPVVPSDFADDRRHPAGLPVAQRQLHRLAPSSSADFGLW